MWYATYGILQPCHQLLKRPGLTPYDLSLPPLPPRTRRQVGGLLFLVGLLCLIALGWKASRIYTSAQALREDVQELQKVARPRMGSETLDTLAPLIARTHQDTAQFYQETRLLLPFTRLLGWVPVVGTDISAAEPLIETAINFTAALDEAVTALAPMAPRLNATDALSTTLLDDLSAARPGLERARELSEQASYHWSRVPVDTLHPLVRQQVQQVSPLIPLLEASIHLIIAVDDTASALVPLMSEFDATNPFTPTFIEQVRSARPHIARSQQSVARLSTSWSRIPLEDPHLPATLRTRVEQATPLVALLKASTDLAVAVDETATALEPVLLLQNENPSRDLRAMLAELAASRPQLERAYDATLQAIASWSQVEPGQLPPELRSRLPDVPSMLALARDGLDLALIFPNILGVHGRREYLALTQNPDELRATGGFIGSAGPLIFENGHVVELALRPTNGFTPADYPRPPDPIRRYMNIHLWLFRDGNWSPDFPTAAQTIRYLYKLERNRSFTHVIAFDPTAVQIILSAIGPVTVEGHPEPVTAENVITYMREEYNQGLASSRSTKAFIGPLAAAILSKLEVAHTTEEMVALLRRVSQSLDEHHLLIYDETPHIAEILSRRGWDGAVRPGEQDFLMVVDTNMGYNKVNVHIQQEIIYDIDLGNPSMPEAQLTVRSTNHADGPPECIPWHIAVYSATYESSTNDCHWSSLRVLIPAGSQFIPATTNPTPAEWDITGRADDGTATVHPGEANAFTVGTFLVVPRGEERETSLTYRLPPDVLVPGEQSWTYRLKMQRQPGPEPPMVQVNVRLPDRAVLRSASHPVATREGKMLTFSFKLVQDQTLEVRFQ